MTIIRKHVGLLEEQFLIGAAWRKADRTDKIIRQYCTVMTETKEDQAVFHPSLETAQHGMKSLDEAIAFAIGHGAQGIVPSNYLLQN